jgi:hypothetical protein
MSRYSKLVLAKLIEQQPFRKQEWIEHIVLVHCLRLSQNIFVKKNVSERECPKKKKRKTCRFEGSLGRHLGLL